MQALVTASRSPPALATRTRSPERTSVPPWTARAASRDNLLARQVIQRQRCASQARIRFSWQRLASPARAARARADSVRGRARGGGRDDRADELALAYVARVARAKLAEATMALDAETREVRVIVAADTTVASEGRIFGKPENVKTREHVGALWAVPTKSSGSRLAIRARRASRRNGATRVRFAALALRDRRLHRDGRAARQSRRLRHSREGDRARQAHRGVVLERRRPSNGGGRRRASRARTAAP